MNRRTARPAAIGLVLTALVAIGTAEPSAWLLLAIAGFVALALTWSAATDGSVAAPVVTLLVTALLFVFTQDGLAIGPLIGVVLALVIGDVLWASQAEDDRGRAVVRAVDVTRTVTTTAAASVAAIVIVVVASRLPDARAWSSSAIVVLIGLAAVVQRRRTTMTSVPLPPPPPGR